MDADRYAGQGVEVLARYAQAQPEELRLDIDLNDEPAKQRRPDYGGKLRWYCRPLGLARRCCSHASRVPSSKTTSTPMLLAENVKHRLRIRTIATSTRGSSGYTNSADCSGCTSCFTHRLDCDQSCHSGPRARRHLPQVIRVKRVNRHGGGDRGAQVAAHLPRLAGPGLREGHGRHHAEACAEASSSPASHYMGSRRALR